MRADKSTLLAAAVLCCAMAQGAWAQTQADCEQLASLKLPDTSTLVAVLVEGPQFTPPAVPPVPPEDAQQAKDQELAKAAQAALLAKLPAFCRVTGVIKPAIRFEVWLPMKEWNGKFQGYRQWWLQRRHCLWRIGGRAAEALCHGQYGHGSCHHDSGSGQLGAASPRTGHRPGISGAARDGAQSQSHCRGLLRQEAQPLILCGLLVRRLAGAHRGAPLSTRLRRHYWGCACL